MTSKTLLREEQEEREHFRKVVSSFLSYRRDSLDRLRRSESNLRRTSLDQQRMLERNGFGKTLKALESCVELNYEVVRDIVSDVASIFENVPEHCGQDRDGNIVLADDDENNKTTGKYSKKTDLDDMEKVQMTLKQFVRDWSSEGSAERRMCYGPILDELASVFPEEEERKELKVLVPGAGLGRLAFEIARLGFQCQGNEFSLFMLFASNFVLNKCRSVNCFKIYPWIHQFTNNLSSSDMISEVSFPDVDPNDLAEEANFSMTAGDFLEVYSDPEYEGSQDCVVTCFFIDCAHNVLDFIELIHKVLKPGGRWINLGPLLYHFSDMPREMSLEPSYDVVRGIIQEVGFTFKREEVGLKATYIHRQTSMLEYSYKCVFFSCTK